MAEDNQDEVELVFVENLETKEKINEEVIFVEDPKKGTLEVTGMETRKGDYVFECKIDKETFENRFNILDPGRIVGSEMAILPPHWVDLLRGNSVMKKSRTKKKNSKTDKDTKVKKKSPDRGKLSLEEFKKLGKKEKE